MALRDELDELQEGEPGLRLPGFLLDPKGVLRRRGLAMGITLLLGIAVATVVAWQWKLTYQASAKILLINKRIPEDFVRSTIMVSGFEQFFTLTAEVLSIEHLTELIQEHDLYREERSRTPMPVLARKLQERITVEPVGGYKFASKSASPVFEIRFEDSDPVVAAQVTNDIVGRIIAASIELRARDARVTTDFMRRELERAEEALREQGRQIAAFRAKHRGELPEELRTNLAKLDRLQGQRQTLATQIADTEERLSRMTSAEPSDLAPDVRLLALRDQLRQQLALFTEEHPNVVALRRQIDALEKELAASATGGSDAAPTPRQTLIQETQRELVRLREQAREVEREIQELDARVARTPALQEELAALLRDESVLHENYMDYLRKVKEAELAESLESAQQGMRLTRLEPALAPGQPKYARWQIALAGYGIALALALAVGLLLELRSPVITSGEELSSLTGARLLGSVPRLG